ncbi:hypothetical protein KGF57_003296 [Candida theae]|uniref:Uncharacterized protein n=1 Tax=Candida theae TaxID=1198502 RepID=A0AAD5BDN6_9ASCO|nr:uncharacterized protein KGF57_003296 [Candida theae]KAI5957602.1 hypothetical protein KGF57_003296 [Candida theae]
MSTDTTAPTIDLSQYEISIVKQAWLALDLFHNYQKVTSSTSQNRKPQSIQNELHLRNFQHSLASKIHDKSNPIDEFATLASNFVSAPSTNIFNDDDLFGCNTNSTNNEVTPKSKAFACDIDAVLDEYQIPVLIQFITIMINYLESNIIAPGQSIINLAKSNVRLSGITSSKYQLFGECLTQTMVVKLSVANASKFQGEEQFIFNKFLSQVLSFLAYYTQSPQQTIVNEVEDAQLSLSGATTNSNKSVEYTSTGQGTSKYPGPTVYDDLGPMTLDPNEFKSAPIKPLTRLSISSSPSMKSSHMSLGNGQYDESKQDTSSENVSEVEDNWKSAVSTRGPESGTDNLVSVGEKNLELAPTSSNESITEPFDYLNSFRCYKTPIEAKEYNKLKKSYSGSPFVLRRQDSISSSSGKRWGLFRRKSKNNAS